MSKIAFLFPGQGSQFVGMGKTLAGASAGAQAIYALADEIMGESISKLSFEGPEARLRQTRYTQPAILAHSLAALAFLRENGITPAIVAGHSLGEFSALVAAAALDERAAFEAVKIRAGLMFEAGEKWPGAMAAIMGLETDEVAQVCRELEAQGVVVPANLNAPGQIVVAGEIAAVEQAMELAKTRGAKRAIRLPVSGAFHSPLMSAANEGLATALDGTTYRDAAVPLVCNVSAEPRQSGAELREASKAQLMEPVRWEESIRTMITEGTTLFVEVGPGTVLRGLLRKIAGRFPSAGLQAPDELPALRAAIQEVSQ